MEPVVYVAMGVCLLIMMGLAVRAALRREAAQEEAPPASDRPSRAVATFMPEAEAPRCVCGELATQPRSRTRPSRGFLADVRQWLGMLPSYEVFVPRTVVEFCDNHARVFDARLRLHLAREVAVGMAEVADRIATRMAVIEGETLLLDLRESLTPDQRRAARAKTGAPAVSTVRPIRSTGTDDPQGDGGTP